MTFDVDVSKDVVSTTTDAALRAALVFLPPHADPIATTITKNTIPPITIPTIAPTLSVEDEDEV